MRPLLLAFPLKIKIEIEQGRICIVFENSGIYSKEHILKQTNERRRTKNNEITSVNSKLAYEIYPQ